MTALTWNGRRVCSFAGACALLACRLATADEPPPKSWFQQITVNAFASASYTWNFNDPQSNLNQLRAFDYDHNSIRIDAAEVVVQKAVAARGDFGFRIDLAMGAVAKVAAARGLFRDPVTGNAQDFDLQQAFASYVVPLGRGIRVDAGKFVTPVGAEYIDGYDGYNDNFSRSLLFTLGHPVHPHGAEGELRILRQDRGVGDAGQRLGQRARQQRRQVVRRVVGADAGGAASASISTTSAGPSAITTTPTFATSPTSAPSTSRRRAA